MVEGANACKARRRRRQVRGLGHDPHPLTVGSPRARKRLLDGIDKPLDQCRHRYAQLARECVYPGVEFLRHLDIHLLGFGRPFSLLGPTLRLRTGKFTNIVQDGKLIPAALAAKNRGVIFDVGHGGGSFDYTVAEVAIAAGATPDTISSDIHVFSANTPGMPYLTWVMSKFLNLGFTLEQVVAMATINPAKAINKNPKLGTLQVGAPADVSVLEVVEGPVEFVDTRNNKRQGKVHLKPSNVVLAGVPFGRPYQAPFAVR
jgi:hypothetical protein